MITLALIPAAMVVAFLAGMREVRRRLRLQIAAMRAANQLRFEHGYLEALEEIEREISRAKVTVTRDFGGSI
jgi:hypothetical protein